MILAMSTSNICILISITVYLVFVVLIGFKYSKESNSVDEYYLGGRKLGPLVTAMSAEASDMSSLAFDGASGTGLCYRYCKSFMDSYRISHWYICQLACGSKETQEIFTGNGGNNNT